MEFDSRNKAIAFLRQAKSGLCQSAGAVFFALLLVAAKPTGSFSLTFPAGPPVGELRTVDDNSTSTPASGVCKFARGTSLILRLNQRGVDDIKSLQGVGPEQLYGLDLADLRVAGSTVLSRANKLVGLWWLRLKSTDVTDDSLGKLSGLTRLKWLHLRNTRISGSGFKSMRCRDLDMLWLSTADITDDGIKSITAFPNLKELFLEGTKITDAAMPTLAKLSKLESLGLASCRISDKGLLMLAPLKRMDKLELGSTKVSDSGLVVVRNFDKLRHLDVEKTRAGDACLSRLPNRLQVLILSRCSGITSAGLPNIVAQKQLKQLNIGFTSVQPGDLHKLSGLSSLRELDLSGIDADDEDLVFLEKLPLKRLGLAGTNAGQGTLTRLAALRTVEQLDLTGTPVGDSAIPILAKFKSLKVLNISNTNITPDGIARLRKILPGCEIGYL